MLILNRSVKLKVFNRFISAVPSVSLNNWHAASVRARSFISSRAIYKLRIRGFFERFFFFSTFFQRANLRVATRRIEVCAEIDFGKLSRFREQRSCPSFSFGSRETTDAIILPFPLIPTLIRLWFLSCRWNRARLEFLVLSLKRPLRDTLLLFFFRAFQTTWRSIWLFVSVGRISFTMNKIEQQV